MSNCLICGAAAERLGEVGFNKACQEESQALLEPTDLSS
jgi:hypothetical protein